MCTQVHTEGGTGTQAGTKKGGTWAQNARNPWDGTEPHTREDTEGEGTAQFEMITYYYKDNLLE